MEGQTPQVAVLFASPGLGIRRLMGGIATVARRENWVLHGPLGLGFEPVLDDPAASGFDGVFDFAGTPERVDELRRLGVRVVNLSGGMARPPFPSVWPDNRKIGRVAADHLVDMGLRRFAYCGDQSAAYSALRLEGFRERLRERGQPRPTALDGIGNLLRNAGAWRTVRGRLTEWLIGLPRPVGILAADDPRAAMLALAAEQAGLAVPGDVALIGVNSEGLTCTTAGVDLSSVAFPFTEVGRAAAELMARLLAGHRVPKSPVLVDEGIVVHGRASTDLVPSPDARIREAVRRIRAEAPHGPVVCHRLARDLSLSRATLTRGVQEAIGRSPKAEIDRIRLQNVLKLLAETDWPVKRLAFETGWDSAENLARFLRIHTGLSPTGHRARSRPTSSVVSP